MSCYLPRQGGSRCYSAIIPALFFILFSLFPANGAAAFTATALGDFDNVTVMEVSGNFDALDPYGLPNLEPRRVIAREFYRTHGDDYDFLVIFTNFDFLLPPGAKAFFAPARNNVSGIGLPFSDATSSYRADGSFLARLEGTIDMGAIGSHVLEPSDPEFDNTLLTLSHEFLHRWGAYVHFLDNGTESDALLGVGKAHWSLLFDSGGSSLYGSHWQDNGDGTFTTVAPEQAGDGEVVGRIFSPLELYLMGLLDKTRVPPMLLVEAPGFDPAQLPRIGVTIPGVARTVTIDDIIAAEGERIPSVADSRKNFRMAFIYAVTPGSWSDSDVRDRGAIAAVNRLQYEWEKRFSILAAGSAMMHTAFVTPAIIDANPDTVVPDFTPAQVQSVSSGVNWLISRQRPEGYWQDQPGSEQRDTSAAVKALNSFPAGSSAAVNGQSWLGTAIPANSDFLARKLLSLESASLIDLLLMQNADGGWGNAPGYVSDAADTALVLQALFSRDASASTAAAAAVSYLHASQHPDGGWGMAHGVSLIQPTASVLLALNNLRASYPLEPVIADGLAWLTVRQNSDGGFGNSASTVVDTAIVLQALKTIGGPSAAVGDALDYLSSRQDTAGSWNGSVFQTAQAIEALYAGQVQADLAVAAADISFNPATIATLPSTVTVTVSVRNLGNEAATSVSVALFDGDPLSGQQVGAEVVDVPGNGVVPVNFMITVAEAGLRVYRIIIDGANRIAEGNEWNNTASRTLAVNMAPPPIGFATSVSAGSEADTVVPLTVTLSYPWPEPITVTYTVNTAGTATPSVDYNLASGTLTFAADETSRSIDLAVVNDFVAEADEAVIIDLANPSAGTLGTARHTYTIRDNEAPAVTITSPPAGVIGQNAPPLLYTTTGGNVVVKVDGSVVAKVSGDTLDPLADGTHSVEVSAANSFGTATTARVDFTIDTALPTVTIHSPLPGAVVNAQPLLDYTLASAVRSEVLIDAVPVIAGAGNPLGPLSDGAHILTINAWNAGGVKNSSQIEFLVDARPPAVNVLSPANEFIRDISPVLRFQSDEAGETVVQLDGVAKPFSAGDNIGPLTGGAHHLRVTVTDAVGNVGSDEVAFSVSEQDEAAYLPAAGWPAIVEGAYGGIAADRSGNVVVVTRREQKELDIVKFDAAGRELWRVIRSSYFNVIGSHWVDLEPKDVALDSLGNIYVAGWGFDSPRYYSFLAKYDADGKFLHYVLLDTARLYGDIQAYSVHVDMNDQVYVSGNTDNALFSADHSQPATMFVARYDADLRLICGKTYGYVYDATSFYFVSRDSMTVDAEQNVWITGRNGSNRLLVWKLAPDLTRTGVEIVGADNSAGMDITADLAGNVHVAGGSPSSGAVWTYVAADGRLLAERSGVSTSRLTSLTVNHDGSVVVVDEAGMVSKLAADFGTLWSIGLGGDIDSKIVPASTGELFVGGSDYTAGIASVAALADPRVPRFTFSQPVFRANAGSVVLSGTLAPGADLVLESRNYGLLGYRHEVGSGLWELSIDGLAEGENRVDVSVAGDGGLVKSYETRVVVDTIAPRVTIDMPAAGSSWTGKPWLAYTASDGEVRVFVNGVEVTKRSGFQLDSLRLGENHILVQSSDAAGNVGSDEIVIQAAGAAVGEYPLAPGVMNKAGFAGEQTVVDTGVDARGNVYVFGDTIREESGAVYRDLYVARYDPAGGLLNFWPIAPSAMDDHGAALEVMASGEFLIAYNALPKLNDPESQYMAVARHAADGRLLWSGKLSSGAGDMVRDLAVDAGGNIYACGETGGRLDNKKYGGNGDYFLVKYNAQGTKLWTVLSNAPTRDALLNLEAADDGFLYGMGRMTDAAAMTLFKFDLNGVRLWSGDYLYPNSLMNAVQMEHGRDGSFYTLIESQDATAQYYYFVTKHDALGKFVNGVYGRGSAIRGLGLSLDLASNVYVTGYADDPNGWGWSFEGNLSFGDEDIFIAKYAAADLHTVWTRQFGDIAGEQGNRAIFSPVNSQAYLAGVTDGGLSGRESNGADLFLVPLTPLAEPAMPEVVVTGYRSPTRQRFQTVSGQATPGAVISVTFAAPAHAPARVSPPACRPDGTWSFTVDNLAENTDNVLLINAVNPAGVTSRAVTISVDTIPPLLTNDPVMSPTGQNSQIITGSVENGAVLTTAGLSVPVTVSAGSWSHTVEQLRAGENVVTFMATDVAGNQAVLSVIINYEPPPPPVLTITPTMLTVDEATDVVLKIDGLSPAGTTVAIAQFLDLDDNGLADSGDPVVRRFAVTDGILHENPNIVSDADSSANGSIMAQLNYRCVNDRYHAVGKYLFTVESPTGSANESFQVVEITQPQGLEGVVRNGAGVPVGGALVELRDPWDRSHGYAMADLSGRYRFALKAPGSYRPVPLAEGYVFDRETAPMAAVAAGESVTCDLTMPTGAHQVGGRVVAAVSAAGLAGVTVQAESGRYLAAGMTAGDGSYRLTLPEGDYGVSVEARPGDGLAAHGHVGSVAPLRFVTVGSDLAGLDLPANPGTTLDCGKTTDMVGAGVGGVPVLAMAADGSGQLAEAYSDAQGRYCVTRAPGEPWPLWLDDRSAQSAGIIGTAGTSGVPDLTVYSIDAWVAGTVHDTAGQPVAGIMIDVIHDGGAGSTVATTPDGRYLVGISSEPAGSWLLTVSGEEKGFAAVPPVTLNVSPGQTATQDFVLAPALVNTIAVNKAAYDTRKKVLTVEATSSHEGANLQVLGYGPMAFARLFKGKYYWTFAGSAAVKPATITVSGREGARTVAVQ